MKTQHTIIRFSVLTTIIFSFFLIIVNAHDVFAEAESSNLLKVNIDWEKFLEGCDPIWDVAPLSFGESPRLGNGRIGMYMFKESSQLEHPSSDPDMATSNNVIRFGVDRADIYDRRDSSWGWTAYSKPRLHAGDFKLYTVGEIEDMYVRQDLYNAEWRGTVTTKRGEVKFRAFIHHERPVIVVELETSGDEHRLKWEFHPFAAITSRKDAPGRAQFWPADEAGAERYYRNTGQKIKVFVPNPPHEFKKEGDIDLCVQKLLVGGGYTTAWRDVKENQNKRTLYVSIAMSHPELTSPKEAVDAVKEASRIGVKNLLPSHRQWWHEYYPKSFISLSDTNAEIRYWMMMYRYGCMSDEDHIIGAYFWYNPPTYWPYNTHNNGSHSRHYPLQPTNHLDLAGGLYRNMDAEREQLKKNVWPEKFQKDSYAIGHCSQEDFFAPLNEDRRWEREIGNLPWYLYMYWLQYRYTMDDDMLRNRLFPLLKGSMNLYFHYTQEWDDGKLHLDWTYSPEYINVWSSFPRPKDKMYTPENGHSRDTNYDLGLFKWGCVTLIKISERLNINDPLLPKWKDLVERLVDYPTDEHGIMVGRDIPFQNNRHSSHLYMIYPLNLLNWDSLEDRVLIEKSVRRVTRRAGRNSPMQYAPSFLAAMGRGNKAMEYGGGSGMSALNMMIQSWGEKIRVFPAMPDVWEDAVIHNLRAEGAFLISAVRRKGMTQFIRVKSLAGEPCIVKTDMFQPLVAKTSSREVTITPLEDNVVKVDLRKGEEAVIYSAGTEPDFTIAPLPVEIEKRNAYGLNSKTD